MNDGQRTAKKRRDDRRRRARRLDHAQLVKIRHGLHGGRNSRGNDQRGCALSGRVRLGPIDFDHARIGVREIDIGFGRELEFVPGNIDRLRVAIGIFDRERDPACERSTLLDAKLESRLARTRLGLRTRRPDRLILRLRRYRRTSQLFLVSVGREIGEFQSGHPGKERATKSADFLEL